MLTDDEILDLVRECDLDWHAGFSIGDDENRYAKLARAIEAALAAAPQGEPVAVYNPWRESLENCISGDNYLRASEYRSLIEELDDLYRLRPAAQPQGEVVVTRNESGVIVLVSRQDDEGNILSIIAESAPATQPSAEPSLVRAATGDTDALAERLIEESDGRWHDGEFRIDSRELMTMLRRALVAGDGAGDARDARDAALHKAATRGVIALAHASEAHPVYRRDYEELSEAIDQYRASVFVGDAPEARDAARYRLLRRGQHWSVVDGIGDTLRADALDAAIDAVMGDAPEAKGGGR